MHNNKSNNSELPVTKSIKTHPEFWNEGLQGRIEDLIVNRAPALIEKFIKTDYEPDDVIILECASCGGFFPDDVHIPAAHLETLLGLNAGDIEALVSLGILSDAMPECESGPWITLEDVLILLNGHVPQYDDEDDDDHDLWFALELLDGGKATWQGSVRHIERVIDLFGDLNDFHVDRLLEYPHKRISCIKAEYLLGLRRLDLKRLAEAGVIPCVMDVTGDEDMIGFAVSDLLNFLQADGWYETRAAFMEFVEGAVESEEDNPKELTLL